MNDTQKTKLIDTLTTPVISGLIAGLATPLIHTNVKYSDKFSSGMLKGFNATLGVGLAVAGSSLISHLSKNYILGLIPKNSQYAELEGRLVAPVVTGITSSLILYSQTDGGFPVIMKNFLLGAVSEVAADYIDKTFISAFIHGTPGQ